MLSFVDLAVVLVIAVSRFCSSSKALGVAGAGVPEVDMV
jgi:hypothetical protein